jgi:hypothetical protein
MKGNLLLAEGEAGFKNFFSGKYRVTQLTGFLTAKRFVACKRRRYFPWGPLIWIFIAMVKRKIVFSIPLADLTGIKSETNNPKGWTLQTAGGREFRLTSDGLLNQSKQWRQRISSAVIRSDPTTSLQETADLMSFTKS